jgi:hypothetical protein
MRMFFTTARVRMVSAVEIAQSLEKILYQVVCQQSCVGALGSEF